MILVFTGFGKGKTTSAIGNGIRAVGSGMKVLMVQFMKVKEKTSEFNVLKELKNFDLYSFGREGFYLPEKDLKENPNLIKAGVKPLSEIDFKLAEEGFNFVIKNHNGYDLIILDEICVALHYELLKIEPVVKFLIENKKSKHFILTGRYCPKQIYSNADLVTEMKEIKHYFKEGVYAIKGIDY
ncbi:cob(I)yrinic acid a,c-diamide adenosyltransferase [Persephonella sp.]